MEKVSGIVQPLIVPRVLANKTPLPGVAALLMRIIQVRTRYLIREKTRSVGVSVRTCTGENFRPPIHLKVLRRLKTFEIPKSLHRFVKSFPVGCPCNVIRLLLWTINIACLLTSCVPVSAPIGTALTPLRRCVL